MPASPLVHFWHAGSGSPGSGRLRAAGSCRWGAAGARARGSPTCRDFIFFFCLLPPLPAGIPRGCSPAFLPWASPAPSPLGFLLLRLRCLGCSLVLHFVRNAGAKLAFALFVAFCCLFGASLSAESNRFHLPIKRDYVAKFWCTSVLPSLACLLIEWNCVTGQFWSVTRITSDINRDVWS